MSRVVHHIPDCSPFVRLMICLAVISGTSVSGCAPSANQAPTPGNGSKNVPKPSLDPSPQRDHWPPERIAKDPEGYCAFAGEQLDSQLMSLGDRRRELLGKQESLKSQKESFDENIAEITNLFGRAKKAYGKAEDEDRWPVKFAGQAFSREKLKSLLVTTTRYIDARKPLAQQYGSTLQKIEDQLRRLNAQVERMRQQQEKLSLDLERIKISKQGDALGDLNQTAFDIAAITENLGREEGGNSLSLDDLLRDDCSTMTEESFLK